MEHLYAIRHKPTGRFIPGPPSGHRGGSWAEPSDRLAPRFFHRERDAKGFLTVWCRGPVVAGRYQTFEGDWEEDISHDLAKAKEPRIHEEYEVVAISWNVAS